MKAELIGVIEPIGESNYDNKVKENLNTMVEVVGHYVDEICEVAQMNSFWLPFKIVRKLREIL